MSDCWGIKLLCLRYSIHLITFKELIVASHLKHPCLLEEKRNGFIVSGGESKIRSGFLRVSAKDLSNGCKLILEGQYCEKVQLHKCPVIAHYRAATEVVETVFMLQLKITSYFDLCHLFCCWLADSCVHHELYIFMHYDL